MSSRCRRRWWSSHRRALSWITEVKWDGYRTLVVKDDRGSRAYTRNGHDWTAKYWPITLAAEVLPCRSAIIDGEMVVLDEQHRSSFDLLQAAIGRQPSRLVFVAFDLMHLDGTDLRKLPLVERRERLARLIADSGPQIQFSEALPGTCQQVFEVADKAGLEGVVCKLADSRYVSGKAKSWLKVKAFEEAEFDLVGVQRESGKPAMALLARDGQPAGRAFITLPAGIRERLWARVQAPSPLSAKPSAPSNGCSRGSRAGCAICEARCRCGMRPCAIGTKSELDLFSFVLPWPDGPLGHFPLPHRSLGLQ